MILVRLAQPAPEVVYVVVRNNGSTTASLGRAMIWDATIGGGTLDGWAAILPPNGTAAASNPALFAGIVTGTDIASGANGYLQVFGLHKSVYLHGTTGIPFAGGATQWDQASLTNYILLPINLYNTYTGATGYLGVITNGAAQAAYPQGYCVPLSYMYTSVSTDGSAISGTMTATSTAFCKAFIKCL